MINRLHDIVTKAGNINGLRLFQKLKKLPLKMDRNEVIYGGLMQSPPQQGFLMAN